MGIACAAFAQRSSPVHERVITDSGHFHVMCCLRVTRKADRVALLKKGSARRHRASPLSRSCRDVSTLIDQSTLFSCSLPRVATPAPDAPMGPSISLSQDRTSTSLFTLASGRLCSQSLYLFDTQFKRSVSIALPESPQGDVATVDSFFSDQPTTETQTQPRLPLCTAMESVWFVPAHGPCGCLLCGFLHVHVLQCAQLRV